MDDVKDDVLEIAKKRFLKTEEYYSEEYQRGDEDVDFALGDQWDEGVKNKRAQDHRPALTENRCMQFVEQVVNAAREMRPAIRVAPVDDKGDVETAKAFKGVIRNIERQSKASVAYDTAVQNAVQSGYGWLHIITDYSDPMSFTQDAKIETVLDWKSCMLDPASEMVDGSDAEYGFKYSDIDEEVFKEKWPDEDPQSFEDADGDWRQDEDKVRVVDYYFKKYEETEICECFLGDGTTRVLTAAQKDEIEAAGFQVTVLQSRTTQIPTVKWCKLYGGGILEETEWLGSYIPLVPVYGKLVWHEGRLKSFSLIKHAKDPQRMLNIIKTTIAEVVGSQPKNQPMVGAVGQFDTDERWEDSNSENYAFLEYDPVFMTDEVTGQSMLAPPPQKQMPMQVSPALFQIEQNAIAGINASLGMYEENRGDESNAISGVAIKSRQIRGDRATYHFVDNLASSIKHVGVILTDLIPKLYNKKQVLRIISTDDKEETIMIDPDAQTDKAQGIYNLNAGKYDVDVDVGPSYATQQQEFLDISTELMRVNPEFSGLAGDKIIEAAGGPYADVIAERIRAQMPPEMHSDDPMAVKVLELSKQLEAAKKETETLVMALDEKKKNEQAEISIKQGELQIKADEAKTKRMETLAKIEEMRLKAQGAESEALADIADAIIEMDTDNQTTKQVLPAIMEKLNMLEAVISQATSQPVQGDAPA